MSLLIYGRNESVLFSFCCQIQMPENLSETEMFFDHPGLFDADQFCLLYRSMYFSQNIFFALFMPLLERISYSCRFSAVVKKIKVYTDCFDMDSKLVELTVFSFASSRFTAK